MRSMECTLRSIGSILLILAVLPLAGCAGGLDAFSEDVIDPVRTREYSAEAISGRVIDGETKRPVQGMVVVAFWELVGGMEGGNNLGAAQVLETLTDEDGKFHLPAWGPIRHTGRGLIPPEAPAVLFYKRGFEAFARANTEPFSYGIQPPYGRTWRWNRMTLEARHLRGDPKTTQESLRVLDNNLLFVRNFPEQCMWKRIPLLILESLAQETELNASGTYYRSGLGMSTIRDDEYYRKVGCGSPIEVLGRLRGDH